MPPTIRGCIIRLTGGPRFALVLPSVAGGPGKLNDLWGDLVNWAREFSVVGVKYRIFADAANRLANVAPERLAAALAS